MNFCFKHQREIFFAILVSLISVQSVADITPLRKTGVTNIRLLSSDYFEAKIEINFYQGEEIYSTYLDVTVPGVSNNFYPNKIVKGMNKIVTYIIRDRNKGQSLKTTHITVVAYHDDRIPFYKTEQELSIYWPGPEYRYRFIKDRDVDAIALDEIQTIKINRYLIDANLIIRGLVQHGYPISKIQTFRPPSQHAPNSVLISKNFSPETIRGLLYIIANSTDEIPAISIKKIDKVTSRREILIGSNVNYKKKRILSENEFNTLKDRGLDIGEMLAIFYLNPPSLIEKSNVLYEEAYSLLDTNNRTNVLRAKSLLDELISVNPEFTKAYLEIARFHMKSNWPEGLNDAERSILIAKDIDPDMADVRVLLGYVYTHQGRYKEAEEEYKKAETLGTENLWLDTNWGQNFQKQGKYSEAIKHYLRVINSPIVSERNDRPKRWVLRESGIFAMLIEDKQYLLADELYGRSAELYRYSSCELQKQAMLRVGQLGDADGAISSYLRSKKLGCTKDSPALAIAYYVKWMKLKKGGEESLAKSTFRQAESASAGDDLLFFRLAEYDDTALIIPELISRGHDINYVNSTGATALLNGIKSRNHIAVENLIRNGADINKKSNNEFYLPIVYAVYLGDIDMVKLLVKNKANYDIEISGASLDEVALSLGFEEISAMLRKIFKI